MVFKNTYIYIYIYIYRVGPGQFQDCLCWHLEYRFLKDRYGVTGWIQRIIFKMSGSFQMFKECMREDIAEFKNMYVLMYTHFVGPTINSIYI